MITMKRVLAFICQVCPFCVLARKYPGSWIARVVAKEKGHCPCCKAHDELKARGEI